jgi:hypothetical protein
MPRTLNRRRVAMNQSNNQNLKIRISQRVRQFHECNIPIPFSTSSSLLILTASDSTLIHLPIARRPIPSGESIRHTFDFCNIVCPSCGALHWIEERSYRSTINNPLFFSCCQRGQINLPHFPDAPEPLKSLLQDDTDGISLF